MTLQDLYRKLTSMNRNPSSIAVSTNDYIDLQHELLNSGTQPLIAESSDGHYGMLIFGVVVYVGYAEGELQ